MINIPKDQEEDNHTSNSRDNNDLLNTLNEETKTFSRKMEFSGLDYETRREKVENVTDEIIDFLYKENLDRRNVLMNLLKEVIKNSADHSGSDMNIEIILHKEVCNKKAQLRFSLYDEGPGLPYDVNDIKRFFETGKTIDNRRKKGKSNYGVGLGIIKAAAETCAIDLILHNQGKIIHLHNLGFQEEGEEKHIFGYEGFGVFDIVE